MILGDPLQRIADEANPAGRQIIDPAKKVMNRAAGRIGIKRVDREIAPRCVFAPIVGVSDRRPPAVGGDIPTQRRHLDGAGGKHRSDRAVRKAGGDGLDRSRLQRRQHRVGGQHRRQVDVLDRLPRQRIAHCPADDLGLSTIGLECGQQFRHPLTLGPGRVCDRHHCNRRDRLTIIAAVAPQIRKPSQCIS